MPTLHDSPPSPKTSDPPKTLKILNLVLYSDDDPAYAIMREIVRKHNRYYANVSTYFLDSGPEDKTDGDVIYTNLHGEHPFLPGLLKKTVDAFIRTKDMDYDILVRSNVSNLIDFHQLTGLWASHAGIDFLGPSVLNKKITPASGVFDMRYSGFVFVGGWGMCFSRQTIDKIITNRRFLDYSIIDDLSLSDFLIVKFPSMTVMLERRRCEISAKSYSPGVIFYRFNSGKDSRFDDCCNMEECSRRMMSGYSGYSGSSAPP